MKREECERIFNSISDPIMVLSLDNKILEINHATIKTFSLTKKKLIGSYCYKIFHSSYQPPDDCPLEKLKKSQHPEAMDMIIETLNSIFLVTVAPIYDSQGQMIKAVHICKDITERKKAEDKIKSLAKFPSEDPYPVLRIAKNGTLLYANEASFSLLDEWVCKIRPCKCVPEKWHQLVKEVFNSNARKHVEIKQKNSIILFCFVPVPEFDYVNLYGQDITERKKAEQALQDTYQKLKETQEQLVQSEKMIAMGQLAAGISHELNQPLTGIKGFAQAVLMDLEENSPIRKDLNKVVEQANRMDKIIQHVRLFARKSDFEMKELDINQPIEDALMLLNEQLRVHNIRVKKSLAENLPRIQGDHNQLEQILINLITNARDAIDSLRSPGGGEVTLQSALSRDKKRIEITFEDTGCGISKENLSNIFNPFFTTKSPDGGVGLGLSIAYRIIENHKGSIGVDSEEGKGTTFRIILPVI